MDVYKKDGSYLGSDGKNDDKTGIADDISDADVARAYFAQSRAKGIADNISDVDIREFTNLQNLNVSHEEFLQDAATVFGESTAYIYPLRTQVASELQREMYAIASVHQRNNIAFGANSLQAKNFLKASLREKNETTMQFAVAARINVALNGIDYSNGANAWDGQEQAEFPDSCKDFTKNGRELHKNTEGWTISDEHFAKWEKNVGVTFQAPQISYTPGAAWKSHKFYMPNVIRLESRAVWSKTIFWKKLIGKSILKAKVNNTPTTVKPTPLVKR